MNFEASALQNDYCVAFFDIDGTLTPRAAETHDGNIPPSEAVCEAIRDFVDAGNVALLSTGRGPAGINAGLKALPFAGYLALGGAYVVLGEKAVLDMRIEAGIVEELIEFMDAHNLTASFDGPGVPSVLQCGKPIFEGKDAQGWDGSGFFTCAKEALEDGLHTRTSKVNMEEGTWEVLSKAFPGLDRMEHFFAGVNSHELTAKGVTKALGAQALLDVLPKGRGKTLAFGDSENDRAILQLCDISVVMGTAPADLLEDATLTTGSVAQDGVATAIRQLRDIWS